MLHNPASDCVWKPTTKRSQTGVQIAPANEAASAPTSALESMRLVLTALEIKLTVKPISAPINTY